MSNWPSLTIVMGIRNRAGKRLERCLSSLEAQTFKDFRAILVDYGSDPEQARITRQIVERFPFCGYVYSETRGYPWNRSRALNIGGKMAASKYIMTTDVDMIFPSDFLRVMMDNAGEGKVLYCAPDFLEAGFKDWGRLEEYAGKYRRGGVSSKGGCQVIPSKTFHDIRGFDETYPYWGTEDRDMNIRLIALGFKEYWLNDQTYFFHQWHPVANSSTMNFMPDGLWNLAQIHFYSHISKIVRNQENWGEAYRAADRRVFEFVDPDTPRLLPHPSLSFFDEPPYVNASIIRFGDCFLELDYGQAIAVNHAFFPAPPRWAYLFPLFANRLLKWSGRKARINWQANNLHAFLAEFIGQNIDWVDDYYLGLPVKNGVSVIVKKYS
jgi:glycosyltransferase involved in cell wall biosynthesis